MWEEDSPLPIGSETLDSVGEGRGPDPLRYVSDCVDPGVDGTVGQGEEGERCSVLSTDGTVPYEGCLSGRESARVCRPPSVKRDWTPLGTLLLLPYQIRLGGKGT